MRALRDALFAEPGPDGSHHFSHGRTHDLTSTRSAPLARSNASALYDMSASGSRNACDARSPPAVFLLEEVPDAVYNRTSYTLAAREAAPLAAALGRIAATAAAQLDHRAHCGSHPCLGILDHISCHAVAASGSSGARPAVPLAESASSSSRTPPDGEQSVLQSTCDVTPSCDVVAQGASAVAASEMAHAAAAAVSASGIPVYLYGQVHPAQRPLQSLRRSFGYFATDTTPESVKTHTTERGALADTDETPPPEADYPARSTATLPQTGVCCVGAGPWVLNLNVLLPGTPPLATARRVARAVSARHGGLPGVEALALPHGSEGVEIACNLLDVVRSPPVDVVAAIVHAAAEEGLSTGEARLLNMAPAEALERVVAAEKKMGARQAATGSRDA